MKPRELDRIDLAHPGNSVVHLMAVELDLRRGRGLAARVSAPHVVMVLAGAD